MSGLLGGVGSKSGVIAKYEPPTVIYTAELRIYRDTTWTAGYTFEPRNGDMYQINTINAANCYGIWILSRRDDQWFLGESVYGAGNDPPYLTGRMTGNNLEWKTEFGGSAGSGALIHYVIIKIKHEHNIDGA